MVAVLQRVCNTKPSLMLELFEGEVVKGQATIPQVAAVHQTGASVVDVARCPRSWSGFAVGCPQHTAHQLCQCVDNTYVFE